MGELHIKEVIILVREEIKNEQTKEEKELEKKDYGKQIQNYFEEVRMKRKNKIEDDKTKETEVKTAIKNLKLRHIPLDLRPKLTRAMRRRMTKFERKSVTLRQLKRKLNFPMRKFAVPTKA